MTPSSTTIDEDAGTITFTITRSGDRPAETIYVSTVQGSSNGYASNSGDYTGISNQALTFTSGQSSRTVTVSINNDTTAEGDETFGIIVQRNSSDPVGTYLDRSTFTIRANDQPQQTTYSMTPSSTTIDEDAGTITFTITRSGDQPAETIYVSTVQGSSNGYASNSGDYTGISNQALTFSSGQSSRTVTVSISNDTTAESDETFGIIVQRNSSDPVGTYLDRSTFTIRANDQPQQTTYTMTPSSTTIDEDAGTITFTITRSGDQPAETIYASTVQGASNGYASNSGDYTGILNQAITFSSGQSSRTVTVSINNDTIAEGDETFGIIVQRNSTDSLSTFLDSSTFTIRANDQPQQTTYSMTPSSTTIDEDAGTITFTITRSGDQPAETIYASTVHGAANGYASNSDDYTGILNQALTFSSGQSSRTVTVSINNDAIAEGDETFGLIVQRNGTEPLSTFLDSSTFTIRANDQQTTADTVREGTDTTHSVSVGGSVTGTIEQTGVDGANTAIDKDWYKVSLVAGHTYTFDATAGVSGSDSLDAVAIRLYSSNSNAVTSVADGASPRLVFTATETRDYWIAVSAGGSGTWQDKTGEYRITVADGGLPATGPDDYADSLTDNSAPVGALTIGQERTGRINVADADDGAYGDKDVFRVDLVAGQYYEFNLDGRSIEGSTLRSGLFTIRDQNFNTLETSSTGSDITEGFLAQRTGAYYVRVGTAGSAAETGGYALSVNTAIRPVLPDDYADHGGDSGSPGSLTPGGATRSGTIEVAGDKDYFAVQLVAGQTYSFNVSSLSHNSAGPLGELAISLSDGSAFTAFRDFDDGYRAAAFEFEADRTGTFYIRVSGDGDSSGGYSVGVSGGRSVVGPPPLQPTTPGISPVDEAAAAIDYLVGIFARAELGAIKEVVFSDSYWYVLALKLGRMPDSGWYDFLVKTESITRPVGWAIDWGGIISSVMSEPEGLPRVRQFVIELSDWVAEKITVFTASRGLTIAGSAGGPVGGLLGYIVGAVGSAWAYENFISSHIRREAGDFFDERIAPQILSGQIVDSLAPKEYNFEVVDLSQIVYFDEQYYITNYSDVAELVSAGMVGSAYAHFVTVGIDLGYKPNASQTLTRNDMAFRYLNNDGNALGNSALYQEFLRDLAGDGVSALEHAMANALSEAAGAVAGAALDARLSGLAHRKALDLAVNTPEDAVALADGSDSLWALSWSNGAEFDQAFAAELAAVLGEDFTGEAWELFVVPSSAGSASEVLAKLSAQAAWSGRGFDTFGIAEVGGLWVVIAADRSDTYEVQVPEDDGLSQITQYGGLEGETLYAGLRTGRLFGLGGDDALHGGRGADLLDGGTGDDVLDGGSSGLDTLSGGDGVDTVSHASSSTGVQIYLDGQVTWDGVTTDNLSSIENAIGSAHADYIGGDAGANRLDGGAGNDVLDGGAGDDVLVGGLTGLDHLRGGSGVDQITYAGHATGVQVYLDNQHSWDGVTMDFLSSIENVIGTAHADYMAGDAAANRLEGGGGDDFLEGGAGDDILIGGLTGLDHLRGGEGVDQITYAGHATGVQIYLNNQHSWDGVTMDFLSSIENAIGSSHADYMAGNAAANRLEGGAGDDFLEGGAGDDILIGGLTGLDHLRGGEGVDQITYAGHATGVQIYLDTEVSWDGVTMDFLSSIENVIGSSHADYMAGNASANRLEGGAGDDFLDGGAGDDFLDGGASGLDTLRGGAGIDTVSYASSGAGVEIYLDNQITWDGVTVDLLSSIENVVGSAHADYIAGDAGANRLEGGGGDDVINGGAGTDVFVLRGLAADYTITAEAGGFRVTDAVGGRDGSDLLTGMETLRFSDGTTMVLTSGAPEVLPALAGDKAGERPEVLPGAHDDLAKDDGSSPEVLPAVDDSFVLTGKTELPPVLPPVDEFESRTEMEQAREQMMALARENWLHRFDDNLTLPDDWSGVGPPSRGEGWD